MALQGALILWFSLTFLSLLYLTYALIYKTPGPWVMKMAWFLVILYTGPIGLFFYLLTCHEPIPGTHEHYIKARWKQSFGSMVHCLAGDATGIIIVAIVLSALSISNLSEMILEYVGGFVCGLLIFQALFMKDMMGGSYWKAVKGTFMAEWTSMNMIMAAMLPTMFVWRYYDPAAADPATLSFWGSMSLAAIFGGIFAYPINDWLVTNGLKHGMVSLRNPGEAVAQIVVTTGGMVTEHSGGHEAGGHEGGHGEHGGKSKVSVAQYTWVTIITLLFLVAGATIGLIW